MNKKVIVYRENSLLESGIECYEVWKRGTTCENCISIRAYKENDTFKKMEYIGIKIYLVSAIPITIDDQRLVLETSQDITDSLFINTGSDKRVIEIQTRIDNIDKEAIIDSLTNIYNRRFINERLLVQIITSKLNDELLSFIFVDIDHFKQINDIYGHCTGDFILKSFACELVHSVRTEKDWVVRYGGEEFLICLPNVSKSCAEEIAERVRKLIMNKTFDYQSDQIKITASFGVSTIEELEEYTIDELIEKADKKLYRAKSEGRNKVVA